MSPDTIIRVADVCDDHPEARVLELTFRDHAAFSHFHGEVVTFATYEDNKGIREILARGGAGKVLVVDGRGSQRRALCGGNIAAEAEQHGWAGMIFNGAIRDQHEFHDLAMGVKSTHTTPMRPRTDGIGLADVDLNMGNVVIRPGDYCYADKDGVIFLDKPEH